jgi:hypothetical protein
MQAAHTHATKRAVQHTNSGCPNDVFPCLCFHSPFRPDLTEWLRSYGCTYCLLPCPLPGGTCPAHNCYAWQAHAPETRFWTVRAGGCHMTILWTVLLGADAFHSCGPCHHAPLASLSCSSSLAYVGPLCSELCACLNVGMLLWPINRPPVWYLVP